MPFRDHTLIPLEDRGPLRVMFLITSMPVGGAETLLVNLVRRLDRERFLPSLACMKSLGPLGEKLAAEVSAFHGLIHHKYDVAVLGRLARLFAAQHVDALVTVGAGDKMFWGRVAARRARLPVVLSALHSTGWPDAVSRLNRSRLLTRWTDGFIGVAAAHGRHLIDVEGFAAEKVHVIPNGVDVEQFHPLRDGATVRRELGLPPTAPVIGIVAGLRPEKNHEAFLRAAALVRDRVPQSRFVIVGDGPERDKLVQIAGQLGLAHAVHFVGNRADVPDVLAAIDIFALTSRIEANPVSILEAMASAKPVVAPRVGSIGESVKDGESGFLTEPGDPRQTANRLIELAGNPALARRLGRAGRAAVVERWSLEKMVEGYQNLIAEIYRRKCRAHGTPAPRVSGVAENPGMPAGTQP